MDEERYARTNLPLSELEAKELDLFEQKKTGEIEKIKKKKLARDNVPAQVIPAVAHKENTRPPHIKKDLPAHPKTKRHQPFRKRT